MSTQHRLWALLSLSLLSALPGSALAQLEEIVVTANRREENLQKVPITVNAFSSKDLTAQNITNLSDLGNVTPGVNVDNRSVAWVPTIRGIGTLDVSAGNEAAIATYVDGVYISNVFGATVPFNNLDRVEVLKGPQGTLFGRNATGGLIQFITRDPGDETVLRAKVGYGSYQSSMADLYVSTPVSSTLAYDIAMHYDNQAEGFGRDVTNGQQIEPPQEKAIRTKWVWRPSGATTATFIADYSQRLGTQGDEKNLLPGSAAPGPTVGTPGFQNVIGDYPAHREVEQWGFSGKLKQEFSDFDLLSITALRRLKNYGTYDNDATPLPIVAVDIHMRVETFTQELQLLSHQNSAFTWIAGAFFMNDINGWVGPEGIRLVGNAFGCPTCSLGSVDSVKTVSSSVFGEGTYKFTDATRLTVGLRYTRDTKELIYDSVAVFAADGTLTTTLPAPVNSATFSKPTWRFVLDHDIGQDTLVYASYNRGYRAGAYNSVFPSAVPVSPEIVDAVEVGSKSELFNRRLQLNGSVFYDKYKNLQVIIAQGPSQLLLNAASADIKGAELDADSVLTDSLHFKLGASYLDSRYNSFEAAPCSERNAAGQTVGYTCSPSGNPLVRAPKFTFNLGPQYTVETSHGSFALNLNYFWTARFNWEPDGRLVEPAYGLLGSQLSWTSADKHYTVRGWGKNLTNREYHTFEVSQPGDGDQYSAGAPRTYGVEFEYDL